MGKEPGSGHRLAALKADSVAFLDNTSTKIQPSDKIPLLFVVRLELVWQPTKPYSVCVLGLPIRHPIGRTSLDDAFQPTCSDRWLLEKMESRPDQKI